jgi:hypothetical protein
MDPRYQDGIPYRPKDSVLTRVNNGVNILILSMCQIIYRTEEGSLQSSDTVNCIS